MQKQNVMTRLGHNLEGTVIVHGPDKAFNVERL